MNTLKNFLSLETFKRYWWVPVICGLLLATFYFYFKSNYYEKRVRAEVMSNILLKATNKELGIELQKNQNNLKILQEKQKDAASTLRVKKLLGENAKLEQERKKIIETRSSIK